MQHRFLIFAVSAILAVAPALADTSTTTNVNPSNSLSVNPSTNQNASTANVSTQINNQNIGQNSYGNGVACQSPQIALGGYGARQSSGVGLASSTSGVSIQYLAPVGRSATRSCAALANEMLKARKLDNSFTTIQKCVDFAHAGVMLDPAVYPELAHACAGIHVASLPQAAAPPSSTGSDRVPGNARLTRISMVKPHKIHFSDFSPAHNSELRRIALHRMQRLAMLKSKGGHTGNAHQRHIVALHIKHEDAHLRAVIAEYNLENAFLRRLLKDQSWHAHNGLRERILSYNEQKTH